MDHKFSPLKTTVSEALPHCYLVDLDLELAKRGSLIAGPTAYDVQSKVLCKVRGGFRALSWRVAIIRCTEILWLWGRIRGALRQGK
jgi:hypothetical protein